MSEYIIKTGAEIADELFVSRDATVCHPELEKEVNRREGEKWITLDEFHDCLDLLFEMTYQACAVHPYGVEDCLDSMALRTNVDAMHYLAKHGRLKITKEVGRRVFATVVNHTVEG
jgi:hypothetical protein